MCALVLVPAAPAALSTRTATVPCWKRLLNDWYDGTINNIYPLPCYQQAIDHLPVDVRVYSSARDDILAAEQAAANHQHAPREGSSSPPTTTTSTGTGKTSTKRPTTTAPGTSKTPATTTGSASTPVEPTQTTTTPTTTDASPPKKKHGVAGLLADITPGDPQSFPLPLLVLGALAILLVIAGGAGMIWQRTHPRDSE